MPVTVYKVGGSLFSLPDLAARLGQIIQRDGDEFPLIVAGGGEAANLVRQWDDRFQLSNDCSHRLALQAMELNEGLLLEILGGSVLVQTRDEATAAWNNRQIPVLNAVNFIDAEENASATSLPATWELTSDSISAWVSERWPADRLVLVKSTELPADLNVTEAAEIGLVDECFPEYSANLHKIDWVNLRSESQASVRWNVR